MVRSLTCRRCRTSCDYGLAQTNLARHRGKPAHIEAVHFDGEESLPTHCLGSSRFRVLQRLQRLGEDL